MTKNAQKDIFNLAKLKSTTIQNKRYEQRLKFLTGKGQDTSRISNVVEQAIKNIEDNKRSFVIYGEPQSGKTELMIALTAKLLDEGHQIIIELMNDSVQLLSQNLERFQLSGLSPSPKKFSEILSPDFDVNDRQLIIFCKKNAQDLKKLITKLEGIKNIIVIDDEADYATPNSKVNDKKKSSINDLTGKLIENAGVYIGVTATPARLDLNRTHQNVNKHWIDFPPHDKYTGQEVFFPLNIATLPYTLTFVPRTKSSSIAIREAMFSFMVNVGYLNVTEPKEKNFSLLIHTSGKKSDHSIDYKLIIQTFEALKSDKNKSHAEFIEQIWQLANERYPGNADKISEYILVNSDRNNVVVMNSDKEKNAADNRIATSPTAPFTIVIGGNIVSRGVTFDNLLSMFFTRDVKHKLQQDTYIQRARMFGSRGDYLKFFELSIPESLYLDWQKCFIFHKLSLKSRDHDNESPIWLDGQRITAVSSSSIDNTTVLVDQGEMSFALFDYPSDQLITLLNQSIPSIDKIKGISTILGPESLPSYLVDFIEGFSPLGDESIVVHNPRAIKGYKDKAGETDKATIFRTRGFIGTGEMGGGKYPNAIHHINIMYNETGKARVFYKYAGNIRFLKAS